MLMTANHFAYNYPVAFIILVICPKMINRLLITLKENLIKNKHKIVLPLISTPDYLTRHNQLKQVNAHDKCFA